MSRTVSPPAASPTAAGPSRGGLYLGIGALLLALALFLLVPLSAAPWVKSLHVLAVIAWMAGMLYLPRLYVYHAEVGPGTPQSETFKVMERRLLRGILNPAMIVTWLAGAWLAWNLYAFKGGWLHAKIGLVVLLSGLHGYLAGARKRFERDANTRSPRHWRIVNEVPAALLVLIVILVIVQPF